MCKSLYDSLQISSDYCFSMMYSCTSGRTTWPVPCCSWCSVLCILVNDLNAMVVTTSMHSKEDVQYAALAHMCLCVCVCVYVKVQFVNACLVCGEISLVIHKYGC